MPEQRAYKDEYIEYVNYGTTPVNEMMFSTRHTNFCTNRSCSRVALLLVICYVCHCLSVTLSI